MKPFTLQEYHDNPELQRRVRAQASRERSQAVYEAFSWLWQQAKAMVKPRAHGYSSGWLARIG